VTKPVPAAARVRLVDVAKAAGVSKTTVSDALNDAGRLPPATREHVRQVARRLGYRPNATAKGLRAGHTRLIGLAAREYVAAPWAYAELAYFAQLIAGATRAAQSRGYGVLLLPTAGPDDYWLDVPLDGVFVIDPVDGDPTVADFLAAGVPVVSDRRAVAAAGAGAWVDFDNDEAIRRVLDHLADAGAKRIAILTGATSAAFYLDSERSYRAWCAERGREPNIAYLTGPGREPTFAALTDALARPEPPDAIVTLTEVNPPQLLQELRRRGRSVPGDLLLVCVTDDPTAPYTDPPISTLSFLPAETAMAAVELLIDQIEGREHDPGRLFEARFDVRASSAFTGQVSSKTS